MINYKNLLIRDTLDYYMRHFHKTLDLIFELKDDEITDDNYEDILDSIIENSIFEGDDTVAEGLKNLEKEVFIEPMRKHFETESPLMKHIRENTES